MVFPRYIIIPWSTFFRASESVESSISRQPTSYCWYLLPTCWLRSNGYKYPHHISMISRPLFVTDIPIWQRFDKARGFPFTISFPWYLHYGQPIFLPVGTPPSLVDFMCSCKHPKRCGEATICRSSSLGKPGLFMACPHGFRMFHERVKHQKCCWWNVLPSGNFT